MVELSVRRKTRTKAPYAASVVLILLLCLLPCRLTAADESYTLRKGETLYRISRKFDVPVDILIKYNSIDNPNSLREGTRINIPRQHTVEKGDTLYSISRRYGLKLDTLVAFNDISNSSSLRIGTVLFLPESATPPAVVQGSGSTEKPATVAQNSVKPDLLWPHPGSREHLSGRITGTLIHGSLGDAVVSVSSGRVIWAGPYRGFSRVILIEGKNGYTYVYAGNEETLVTVGDTVVPGAEIGRLGKDVHQGVPQLYFLVYRNGKPVDPSLAPRS
jgi:murein DD-endopeptidase MepM/ murein hydrolase activator NlpD